MRRWVNAEVILPGARWIMAKGNKEMQDSPPEWVCQLKHMCEVALGSRARSTEGEGERLGHVDVCVMCHKCRQDVRQGTAEVVFTCFMRSRSLHPYCCGEVLGTWLASYWN